MKLKSYHLLFLFFFRFVALPAQDLIISFAGAGASTTVATVKVENLMQQTNLTMSGSNVLHLMENISGVEPGEAETLMLYNTGDRLKFTGIEDFYSTVIVDVPTETKTITFYFVPCTDRSGNNYPVVRIKNQVWMAENLRTSKYNDGVSITRVTDSESWPVGVQVPSEIPFFCTYELPGAYGWSNHDSANCEYPYGKIYNWSAVETGKLCPSGFHVPDFDELETLFYGYYQETQSGTELMATDAWPDTMFKWGYKPTNSAGFSALPSHPGGTLATFWTASGYAIGECNLSQIDIAIANTIPYDNLFLYYSSYWRLKEDAFNIRCLKDPYLDISPTNILLSSVSGAVGTFTVFSNTTWNINDTFSWLSISSVSGIGDKKINITATSENTGVNPRTAIITITGTGTEDKTIEIIQDPSTTKKLGNTEVYSSTTTAFPRRAQPVIFTETGMIQSISIYHNGGNGKLLSGIYEDCEDKPSARLGVTSETSVNSAEGWQTVPLINPITVIAGQKVWLSWVFDVNPGLRYAEGEPARAQSPDSWSGGMPDPFGPAVFDNYRYSLFCTYTTETVDIKNTSYRDKEDVQIYPNPTDGKIRIIWKNRYSYKLNITIYDILGKVIKTIQTDPNVNEIIVDLEEVKKGIYILEIRDNKNVIVINKSRIIRK